MDIKITWIGNSCFTEKYYIAIIYLRYVEGVLLRLRVLVNEAFYPVVVLSVDKVLV